MSTGFVHSIKVPRLFKVAANIVKKVSVDGESYKTLLSKPNHVNVQGIYALVSETLQHSKELQFILDSTEMLVENPRFDPWLARILLTELLWGKKVLKGEAKPIVIVLSYKEKLQQAFKQISDSSLDPCDKKKVNLPRYVRVNTLLMSIEEALDSFYYDGWNLLPKCEDYQSYIQAISQLGSYDFIQDFHIPEVFVFPPKTRFYDHPGYLNGKFLLQDKASCLPSHLLGPKPDSVILDMCAAPGMKTTHLAAIINNLGKIYAVELKADRYNTLCDFVNQTNAQCVEVINTDALAITPENYPNIEYILVDPSCSGSGMDRIEFKSQGSSELRNRLQKLSNMQSMILSHALSKFPNVKKVAYSTCSLYAEENEWVIEEALNKFQDTFKLVNLKKRLKGQWENFGADNLLCSNGKCLYALPDKDYCKGFFIAIFKRKKKTSVEDESNEQSELKTELIQDTENIEQTSIVQTEEDVEVPVKKSKKSKKRVRETDSQSSINIETNDSVNIEKKKKKKKKEIIERDQ